MVISEMEYGVFTKEHTPVTTPTSRQIQVVLLGPAGFGQKTARVACSTRQQAGHCRKETSGAAEGKRGAATSETGCPERGEACKNKRLPASVQFSAVTLGCKHHRQPWSVLMMQQKIFSQSLASIIEVNS